MKIQSAGQQKQLQYLRPYLCQWAGDAEPKGISRGKVDKQHVREAGRRRAAPHIKSYIRFSDSNMNSIDWAMITSSNLSTQAWGAAANGKKEVRISSWEIGVIFWPDLFACDEISGSESPFQEDKPQRGVVDRVAEMVPCFKRDLPTEPSRQSLDSEKTATPNLSTVVGFRMPYDLPLTPYSSEDMPWCATAVYEEPDWLGQTWREEG